MNVNWANVFDWMMLLKCFVTGGIICIIGQILIYKTKLTPAKILVIFVTSGAILVVIRYLSVYRRFCRCWRYGSSYWIWL